MRLVWLTHCSFWAGFSFSVKMLQVHIMCHRMEDFRNLNNCFLSHPERERLYWAMFALGQSCYPMTKNA